MGAEFNNRFLEFIKKLYDSAIEDFLNVWVKDNYKELRLKPIGKDHIKVFDIDFLFANIGDKSDSKIEFEVVVDVTFRLKEIQYGNCIVESNKKGYWITIGFVGSVDDHFDSLNIKYCEPYCGKKDMKTPVNGDLLPKLFSIKEYEKFATNYIRKHVDKSYDGSKPIDIIKLIKACGLEAWDFRFAGKYRPFGRIFFEPGTLKVFDGKEEVVNQIPANTICVDTYKNSFSAENKEYITLAHEMSHYMLHRKAFYFQKLIDTDLSGFECFYNGMTAKGFTKYLLNKMEIQASLLAPILLMPRKALLDYTNKLYEQRVIFGEDDILNNIEEMIRDVAKHFKVTIYAARRRLMDIGYFQKSEACVWIDGKYIKPFGFAKGSLQQNETFLLTTKQLRSLVLDKSASKLFRFGDFVFVENHLCINSKRYIVPDTKGNLSLTKWARHNVDKCCLKFALLDNSKDTGEIAILNSLFRDADKELTYKIGLAGNSAAFTTRLSSDRRTRVHNNILEAKKEILSMDFGDSVRYLLKFQKMTMQELANDADVSLSTIKRYITLDKGSRTKPDKAFAVRLCVGLKLCPELSLALCKKAGICFEPSDENDDMYLSILYSMTSFSIEKVKQSLLNWGCPKLLECSNVGSAD